MVNWSESAKKALQQIFNFIASDSKHYANEVIERIILEADKLGEFPHMGRVVPELRSVRVREIFLYSYRIIYKVSQDEINILNVIHGSRKLSSEMLN